MHQSIILRTTSLRKNIRVPDQLTPLSDTHSTSVNALPNLVVNSQRPAAKDIDFTSSFKTSGGVLEIALCR